jgi:hypothetical protein
MVSGSRVDEIRSATVPLLLPTGVVLSASGGVMTLREGMGAIHALLDVQAKAIARHGRTRRLGEVIGGAPGRKRTVCRS